MGYLNKLNSIHTRPYLRTFNFFVNNILRGILDFKRIFFAGTQLSTMSSSSYIGRRWVQLQAEACLQVRAGPQYNAGWFSIKWNSDTQNETTNMKPYVPKKQVNIYHILKSLKTIFSEFTTYQWTCATANQSTLLNIDAVNVDWNWMEGIEAILCDLFSLLFDKHVSFEIFLARAMRRIWIFMDLIDKKLPAFCP